VGNYAIGKEVIPFSRSQLRTLLTTTKKLKIWTIVTHGLILVGAGHGGLVLFLIEIFFPYSIIQNISGSSAGSENIVLVVVVGLLMALGQSLIVFSIVTKIQKLKTFAYIVGLVVLWLSYVYFIYDSMNDRDVYVGIPFAVPFFVCTIIVFFGKPMRRSIRRMWVWAGG
jgi:hypothetical protein